VQTVYRGFVAMSALDSPWVVCVGEYKEIKSVLGVREKCHEMCVVLHAGSQWSRNAMRVVQVEVNTSRDAWTCVHAWWVMSFESKHACAQKMGRKLGGRSACVACAWGCPVSPRCICVKDL
jgi:hypothetical protein